MEQNNLLDLQECSKFLNISRSLLYGLVRTKDIPFIRLGRKIVFNQQSILQWLNTQEKENLKIREVVKR